MTILLRQEFVDSISPELTIHKQIHNVLDLVLSAFTSISTCNPPNNSVKEVMVCSYFTDENLEAQGG